MAVLSKAGIDQVSAPALAPDADAIDRDQLTRMTLGDDALADEVLQLFDRQVDILVARLAASDPAATAGAAHTLKGSAQGIGAWSLVRAAEAVERAANAHAAADLAREIARLAAAADEVKVAIARLLAERAGGTFRSQPSR